MESSTKIKTEEQDVVGISLEQLGCCDQKKFIVKSPEGKQIQLQGQSQPWMMHITRMTVPRVQNLVRALNAKIEKNEITDEQANDSILSAILVGWENFPEPFNLNYALSFLRKSEYSWIRAFIIKTATEDANFFLGA